MTALHSLHLQNKATILAPCVVKFYVPVQESIRSTTAKNAEPVKVGLYGQLKFYFCRTAKHKSN